MRIDGVQRGNLDPDIERAFDMQEKKWGRTLDNHRLYARRPYIFRGVHGISRGLRESGLIDAGLTALLNRRIALINKCAL